MNPSYTFTASDSVRDSSYLYDDRAGSTTDYGSDSAGSTTTAATADCTVAIPAASSTVAALLSAASDPGERANLKSLSGRDSSVSAVGSAGGRLRTLKDKFVRQKRNKLRQYSNKIAENTQSINYLRAAKCFQTSVASELADCDRSGGDGDGGGLRKELVQVVVPPKPKAKPKMAKGPGRGGGGASGGMGRGGQGRGGEDAMMRRPRRRMSNNNNNSSKKDAKETPFFPK